MSIGGKTLVEIIGKIKVDAFRKRGNRYEYHSDKALKQVQNIGDHND